MGCPVETEFKYRETLVSNGRPSTVNFKRRNRAILRAWTYDRDLTFSFTPERITFHGASGAEVMVEFKIL